MIIIIKNNILPFKGYMAMMTLFILWVRKESSNRLTPKIINHERIHSYQQIELLVLGLIIQTIICLCTNCSWWWLLTSIAFPFILYILCWIIEIILPPYDKAYKNICFETEAKYNENNLEYYKIRIPFSEFKYISNKKYNIK